MNPLNKTFDSDELTEELWEGIEAFHASLPFTPGPWSAEMVDGSNKDLWRVVSHAYNDEEPGICGDHSKAWRLSEGDARAIAMIPQVYEYLVGRAEHDPVAAALVRDFKGE